MAHLTLRRSFLDRIEPLSVVYLAVIYAVLTIALAAEWGRIARVMITDLSAPQADVTAPFELSTGGADFP